MCVTHMSLFLVVGHARRKAGDMGTARSGAEAAIAALHLQADAAGRALKALVKVRAALGQSSAMTKRLCACAAEDNLHLVSSM